MKDPIPETCPHCGERLLKWANPDGTTWGEGHQLVCFNDECSYYRNGWKHMMENFNTKASYRFRCNPATGAVGPLPVWSSTALKHLIIEDSAGDRDKGAGGEESP